jgi:ribonuclease HI
VIWADGSASAKPCGEPCGGAITYISPQDSLQKELVTVSHLSSSNDAEILAIREAFRQVANLTVYFDKLAIFSDSQYALRAFQPDRRCETDTANGLLDDIVAYANGFYDQGIDVELHWVPHHLGIDAHERVDKLAKDYRKLALLVAPTALLEYEINFPPLTLLPQAREQAREDMRVLLRSLVDKAVAEGRLGESKRVRFGLAGEERRRKRRLRKAARKMKSLEHGELLKERKAIKERARATREARKIKRQRRSGTS